MKMCYKIILIVLIFTGISRALAQWFEKNMYLCHCENTCDSNGLCDNGKCAKGWFGFKCQYQDLLTAFSISPNVDLSVLTDQIDATCKYYGDINIQWQVSFTFSWIRMKLKDKGNIQAVQLKFIDMGNNTIPCSNYTYAFNRDESVDIGCEVKTQMQQMTLTAGDEICSLYINGGRNMALKQATNQSSTFEKDISDYAVDGDRNGKVEENSCSHTGMHDQLPRFEVTFPKSIVYRTDVYNRDDVAYQDRLSNFTLEMLDNVTRTFIGFAENSPKRMYTLNFDFHTIANQAVIFTNHKATITAITTTVETESFLTLCEVEIYGECAPGSYGLQCENNCNDRCYNKACSLDTGDCIYGCDGYSDPPVCHNECNETTWGRNCQGKCNETCFNNHCNSTTGECIEGCLGYSDPPSCTQSCEEKQYGLNCLSNCSTDCKDRQCHSKNGTCKECNSGYKGDYCNTTCMRGTWGPGCQYKCNDTCLYQYCVSKTGKCKKGCVEGYKNEFCNQKCNETTWGRNCQGKCNETCFNNHCNSTTGECIEGCLGYSDPPSCTKKCDPRHWGQNCSRICKDNCFKLHCDHKTGSCSKGCLGYFDLPTCEQGCNATSWGWNCHSQCSDHCFQKTCNNTTGKCLAGCLGYSNPPTCSKGCDPGYYGHNCSDECNDHCFEQMCNQTTGDCTSGCNGYSDPPTCIRPCNPTKWALNCQESCSENCYNNSCDSITGKCTNGCLGYSDPPNCTLALTGNDSPPVGTIVGSIIGVVIVVAVIIAAVILWRKRNVHKSKPTRSESQSLTNLQATKVLQKDKSKDISKDIVESSLDILDNSMAIDTSIPVQQLAMFMKTHNNDFFSEQFKKIPAPVNVSTEIAQSEENINKNRYKNICPYDHSRVHLKINTGKKEADYINASYIRGYNNEVTFIAAQGPNNLVINDFIRMLWEQNIKKVIMLTNIIEEGKVKCEKYWPDKEKILFGEIEVKLFQTQTFTDYCIRSIELSKQSEKSQVITQYHFTSWPDQGTPYAPWALIDFSERVFASSSTEYIVVHCSAGVGRTGTFIALYNVLRQAEETGQVDFYSILAKLREDRTLMLQTVDQYEFLHRAAQAALACKGTSVTASNIIERLRYLEEREVSGLTKMKKEFQAIDNLCKDIRKSHKEDLKENGDDSDNTYQNTEDLKNSNKNRFPSIVPRNVDRPYLTCESNEMGDYINAVFIPGLKKKDQLILTQLPMPTTIVDFWRLVVQCKVGLVVAFENDKLATDKTIGIYIPMTKSMSLNSIPFDIKCDYVKEDELCKEQSLTVFHEKSKSNSHKITHLQCKFNDLNSRKLLAFVKKIRSYNVQSDGKILYTCRNGATYSALCCAVSLLLDRMDNDSCASVPLVVSIMKTIRPEVIPNVEQYKLLYDVLERYTDVSSPYSNVDENFFPGDKRPKKVNKPASDHTVTDDESIYNNV